MKVLNCLNTLKIAHYAKRNVRCSSTHSPESLSYKNDVIPAQKLTTEKLNEIEQNVLLRRHQNNKVPVIRNILEKLQTCGYADANLRNQLNDELDALPNMTHPRLLEYGDQPKMLMSYVHKPAPDNPKEFSEISKFLNLTRTEKLGNYSGRKSYYLKGDLARMEQAIVEYTVKFLEAHDFQLMSVPDILPPTIIEGCGMSFETAPTQVYRLESGDCLSGTAEMALAGFYANKVLDETELPIRVAAVSRCYRAETSATHDERGIYRVHQFTKLEMFAVCKAGQAEFELENIKEIQLELYKSFGINFRLLDMPPSELGLPAYQKYDIEAWMPGRNMWGEISSCSNCTNYQAKRLGIRYRDRASSNSLEKYANTVNGTAAAIPRLLIAILETNQQEKVGIQVPEVLVPYMGHGLITKNKKMPETRLFNAIRYKVPF